MPESCYDEKVKEVKDKHECDETIPGHAKCSKKCYIVCKVECEREAINVKKWGYTEVRERKDEHWVDKNCDKPLREGKVIRR